MSTPTSSFNERVAAAELPYSGPALYNARRALWLSSLPNLPSRNQDNPSRKKLEALLDEPGATEDDAVWDAGVDRVWRGLVGGSRLKHRLPLVLVLKILQAGWIREGTWPRGAVPPDSDEGVGLQDEPAHQSVPPVISGMSGATTPGSAADRSCTVEETGF
ncbi:uncharacterized protein BXZ73DRAFT_56117 [Epithele typhae]|uniref:uncharacterized protein n=1 Tax=Epithele typhae TaxID=378194 RepID=UPI002008A0EE|nr:uncharacterized protein BXZ73DRAFT_56117 [Epithele typhae]KAH9912617.1 hypothetical protein BXZ73DRAFT_56117 [Epithele typhae]